MNDRRDRGAWLNSFVHAPASSGANQVALARANRALADPSVGPKLTEAYRRYVTTVVAQQEGGAGLLADEQVRYFQRDYHHRLMELGAQYLPTSYRIAEAFFESRPGAPGFYLMPERDYQFSFSDSRSSR